jgi:hypothetical protein
MSGAGDAEQHLHDPPPPAGHYLDRWGFVCEGTSAPPVSKEEAALEARRVCFPWAAGQERTCLCCSVARQKGPAPSDPCSPLRVCAAA